MKTAPATQEPWMTAVARAHREERRERTFALVAFIGACILTLAVVLLSGCTRPLDTAIASANAAHDVGDAASIALDVGCTARYQAAKASDVPAIDAVCIPAGAAYSLYRTSHAALVAGIQAYEAGQLSPVELAVKAAQLASAAKGLSEAIARVR